MLGPRMSRSRAAASSAGLACSIFSALATSPFRQLLRPMRPLAVLREELLVDAGPVVEALGVAGGDELDQVLVALVGLRQQHQVVRFGLRTALLETASLRDIDLTAENRLQPAFACVVVEHDRGKQVAVLGHGERRHLQLHRFVEELVNAAGAVEERELGMKMQMNELVHAAIPTRSSMVAWTRCRRPRD